MGSSRVVELVVGLFVALGLAAFLMLALKVSDVTHIGNDGGYRVLARFDNIGSLKVRAPVTLAGVRIGRVSAIEVDPARFDAVVEMLIDGRYGELPVDTSASILTSGLVGEQYVGLEPGGADEVLRDGDTIRLTQSALVIERLIGRFMTTLSDSGGGR